MIKINKIAIEYVNNLINKTNKNYLDKNSGTKIGNVKSELLKKNGIEFIERYDLKIDELAHIKIYK